MSEQPRGADGKFQSPAGPRPKDWKPFVQYDDTAAEGLTPPMAADASEADILGSLGLEPQDWEVTSIKVSKWQAGEEWKTSYRVSAKRRVAGASLLDTAELLERVRSWKPVPRSTARGAESLVVCLADWQVGKGERGGSAAAIDRILTSGKLVVERVEELRAIGRQIGSITVLGLGDIVENCSGFYPSQTATVDLDTRAQVRVAWELVTALLRMWAPLVPRIDVVPIGGNHGEVRNDGKALMTSADNLDLLVFEAARDILAERPDLAHVKFHLPENPLIAVHEVAGVPIGITHGHLMGGGTNSSAKAEKWWKGQAFGRGDLADARVLVTGHYHHWASTEWSEDGRTWFQTPAMDGGSQWYRDVSGQSARTGILTFLAGARLGPMGWSDLRIV
jgi:hypothetical protein